jgi:hypothetical protein
MLAGQALPKLLEQGSFFAFLSLWWPGAPARGCITPVFAYLHMAVFSQRLSLSLFPPPANLFPQFLEAMGFELQGLVLTNRYSNT